MSSNNTSIKIKLLCLTGLITALPTGNAQEIKQIAYSPDQIYPVSTGLGIATQIEISPQEEVKDFGTGFSSGWDLSRRDNVFYLKPKDEDVDTNMYIRTNQRSYLFELKVVSKNWKKLEDAKRDGVNYRVKFTYPEGSFVEAVQNGELDTRISNYNNYHTNYDYSASNKAEWLVPIKAYDDYKFTYIYIPEMSDFPAVFGRKTQNGEEFIVNTSVEKNVIVVHGVYPYLVLRHGNDIVGLRRN